MVQHISEETICDLKYTHLQDSQNYLFTFPSNKPKSPIYTQIHKEKEKRSATYNSPLYNKFFSPFLIDGGAHFPRLNIKLGKTSHIVMIGYFPRLVVFKTLDGVNKMKKER